MSTLPHITFKFVTHTPEDYPSDERCPLSFSSAQELNQSSRIVSWRCNESGHTKFVLADAVLELALATLKTSNHGNGQLRIPFKCMVCTQDVLTEEQDFLEESFPQSPPRGLTQYAHLEFLKRISMPLQEIELELQKKRILQVSELISTNSSFDRELNFLTSENLTGLINRKELLTQQRLKIEAKMEQTKRNIRRIEKFETSSNAKLSLITATKSLFGAAVVSSVALANIGIEDPKYLAIAVITIASLCVLATITSRISNLAIQELRYRQEHAIEFTQDIPLDFQEAAPIMFADVQE